MANGTSTADLDRLKAARQGGKNPSQAEDAVPFDEETYLRFNPDVRVAVAAGAFRSGRDHYERYGRAEGRPYKMLDPNARNRIVVTSDLRTSREKPKPPVCNIDALQLSLSGGLYINGWVNDAIDPLDSIDLYFGSWTVSLDASVLARVRREDTEAALKNGYQHPYGFWGFIAADSPLPGGQCSVVVRLKSGSETGYVIQSENLEDEELRRIALSNLATAVYFGNHHCEAVTSIETFIAPQLVKFNRSISRRAVAAPYVERFGRQDKNYRGSIVVCLYGRPEYMFLQNALFAKQPGMRDYEFIYVSNSPPIAEQLLKEARLSTHIYGLDQTVIVLNSNAGFGAANNLAASYARSNRVMITNPDVFPYDKNWIEKHDSLVENLPAEQTALFGAPLYYDDGSLMHGGMYFEMDTVPQFGATKKAKTCLLRVEHYGKGAPPDTARFLQARPVPAVTGAFMSVEKSWFEKLGGFTEDYIFGHYEDADLCMKSRQAGRAPWLHDIKLWHLEGKGSTRMPQHEGGSIINRWLFTHKWGGVIENSLLGPDISAGDYTDAEAGGTPLKVMAKVRKS
jgi:GT2 family glycosyltransferase